MLTRDSNRAKRLVRATGLQDADLPVSPLGAMDTESAAAAAGVHTDVACLAGVRGVLHSYPAQCRVPLGNDEVIVAVVDPRVFERSGAPSATPAGVKIVWWIPDLYREELDDAALLAAEALYTRKYVWGTEPGVLFAKHSNLCTLVFGTRKGHVVLRAGVSAPGCLPLDEDQFPKTITVDGIDRDA